MMLTVAMPAPYSISGEFSTLQPQIMPTSWQQLCVKCSQKHLALTSCCARGRFTCLGEAVLSRHLRGPSASRCPCPPRPARPSGQGCPGRCYPTAPSILHCSTAGCCGPSAAIPPAQLTRPSGQQSIALQQCQQQQGAAVLLCSLQLHRAPHSCNVAMQSSLAVM